MIYFSLDVERVGLYGETFAYGFVAAKGTGEIIAEGIHSCPIDHRSTDPEKDDGAGDVAWVTANVLPAIPAPDVDGLRALCASFYHDYMAVLQLAAEGDEQVMMLADIPFPCEAGFLYTMQAWHEEKAAAIMPYPLLDVASVLFAKGFDAIGTYDRLPDELPAHNPLNDARQSLRVFLSAMNGVPF